MLQFFKNILTQTCNSSEQSNFRNDDKLKIATCALFLEIANSDDNFSGEEMAQIYSIMKNTFSLTDEDVKQLIELSEVQIRRSVSLYEFTDIINKNFTYEEKYEIIKNLWRIVLADKILNPYEEHLLKIINGNFNFYHKDLIAAKLEVKEEIDN